MNRKEIVSLLILIFVVVYGLYRYLNRSYTIEKSQFLMDTIVKISATSKTKDVNSNIDKVFEYIRVLEQDLNEYKDGGWLWEVNNIDKPRYPMNSDAYNILIMADSLYRISNGMFDITIKPVFNLWKFDSEVPQLPNDKEIEINLKKVGFDRITYDKNYLYKPAGMQLTFGALAKGYIIDKAKEYMLSLNLTKGFIDCHSSMIFYGDNILPEIVGIQHPRKMNEIIATLQLKNIAIGTSGDYQQYFEVNGKRYHHILNAKNGMPVDSAFSVTVLHPSAMVADGLSTLLFLMNPEKAIELIKQTPNAEAIIYYQKNGGIVSLKSQGIKALIFNEKG
jgi:thiamine biosynthesis lipoprotein